jgi:uncharacterized damage-inducible protein DinB
MIYHSVAEIFDEIDNTRARLTETVSGLSEAELNFRPAETAWSAAQLVEHLAKTEASLVPLVFRLLKNAEADGKPSDGTFDPPLSLVAEHAMVKDVKLQAPQMIRPVEDSESRVPLAESLAKLAETRETIRSLRPRVEAVDSGKTAFPHPFIGKMNLCQWLAFIGLHEARHLAQIEKIIEQARQSN